MEQAQLLNELSEVAERIAEHRLNAYIEFRGTECGDIVVEFRHFDDRYPNGNRGRRLYTFWGEDNLRAWHYQIDKVFEGGLLDEQFIRSKYK
ncbi:hypothetical protein [Macrococcus armenti]|uniref:hypothetical protein n=1 Tax=Macrococcus armenti TaxID=2875764 RepID=UPI001CCB061B|nr:hypothetical protein [Macrococcus armenti]UBH07877.1 hypothetical protein LAU41_07525 [Macrococcus armenti]